MNGNITEVESGSRKAYDEEYLPAEAPDTAHQFSSGIKAPPRDYSIPGKKTSKIFTTIGAAANLVFAFNTGMLPEIQATVRKPVVINMLSALYFHFTAGVLPMYAVTLGIGHMDLLLRHICFSSVHGPVWLKA